MLTFAEAAEGHGLAAPKAAALAAAGELLSHYRVGNWTPERIRDCMRTADDPVAQADFFVLAANGAVDEARRGEAPRSGAERGS